MTPGSFDRRFWLILSGLVLLFALVILAGSLSGLTPPQLLTEDGTIGSSGPVTLVFSESMNEESVESRLGLDPPLQGRFQWRSLDGRVDRMVSFWPEEPLNPGQEILIRLSPGATSQTGLALRQTQEWQVTVRSAEVLYLSPVENPELWRSAPDGTSRVQISQSGGSIFDYTASPDGNWVVYSVGNAQSGFDLWEVSRSGGEPKLLLPCQSDWCINPAFSPDGLSLAYSRRRSGAMIDQGPGVPRIWMLDLSSRKTDILFADPNVGGFEPAWSPDGRFLAFFDGLSSGIRVLDVTDKTDFLLPSQMGMTGEWSPDSQRLIFTDFVSTETSPYVAVFIVDVYTRQIHRVFADDLDQVDYSTPVWTRDGTQVVAALRLMNGELTKQLWQISLDHDGSLEGVVRLALTNDPLYSHAAYRWDPIGENLVFQRLEIGSSNRKPQIALWNRTSQEVVLLADDAFQPRWLP